jgi:hypothetical protein
MNFHNAEQTNKFKVSRKQRISQTQQTRKISSCLKRLLTLYICTQYLKEEYISLLSLWRNAVSGCVNENGGVSGDI